MTTAQHTGQIPEWTQADRLRKAREISGLDQQQLATAIGVSRNTIGSAESGKRVVRKIVLNQWSLATGVPLVWLETGRAAENPRPGDPDGGGALVVRRQGLEPRTRWIAGLGTVTPLRDAA